MTAASLICPNIGPAQKRSIFLCGLRPAGAGIYIGYRHDRHSTLTQIGLRLGAQKEAPVRLTRRLLERAQQLHPQDRNARIVLDPRGIHHRTVPAKNFESAVVHHADQRKLAVAESLCVVKRLRDIEAVHPLTDVRGQGAVFQSFRGAGERQGCHTMPCQLVLDHQYPHQLLQGDGQSFTVDYVTRSIELFARCTWSPRIVNPIDQALDWTPEADFVKMYLDSVQWVLSGQEPRDAYHELSWRRQRVLNDLHERVRDEPLNVTDAIMLMGAITVEPGQETVSDPKEIERLLADQHYIERLQDQREVVIETYAAREQIAPTPLETGELQSGVNAENWVDSTGSTINTAAASSE